MDKQKKAHLLGLSHPLNPAVTIAEKGLSETVQFEPPTAKPIVGATCFGQGQQANNQKANKQAARQT